MKFEIVCKSVAGGWQSCLAHTECTFGPVFNKVNDLWEWQKVNLAWTEGTDGRVVE